MATKLAARAAEQIVAQMVKYHDKSQHKVLFFFSRLTISSAQVNACSPDTATLLGIVGRSVEFRPLEALRADTDYDKRLPRDQW